MTPNISKLIEKKGNNQKMFPQSLKFNAIHKDKLTWFDLFHERLKCDHDEALFMHNFHKLHFNQQVNIIL